MDRETGQNVKSLIKATLTYPDHLDSVPQRVRVGVNLGRYGRLDMSDLNEERAPHHHDVH